MGPVTFSIHALLAESDVTVALSSAVLTFLSTLSLRRATISMGIAAPATAIFYPRSPCGERRPRQWGFRLWGKIFYPRSPCGERQFIGFPYPVAQSFSIHALLAESDQGMLWVMEDSTFSIHALLAESDNDGTTEAQDEYFSIHALLAESDTPRGIHTIWAYTFLSTLSLRRATC